MMCGVCCMICSVLYVLCDVPYDVCVLYDVPLTLAPDPSPRPSSRR